MDESKSGESQARSGAAPSARPRYPGGMILAALVIGALTAYYFGLRKGAIAAVASAVLFVYALFVPSQAMWVYGGVAAAVGGLLLVGPRMPGRERNKRDLLVLSRKIFQRGLELTRRFQGGGKNGRNS